LSCRAIYRGG